MPPAKTADEGLVFLFYCIKHKTGPSVNFQAVADELGNMTANAARLRFMRIRKIIEGEKGEEKGVGKEAGADKAGGPEKGAGMDGGKAMPAGGQSKKRKLKVEDD